MEALADGSHPIGFCLCLCPWTHTTVGKVIVAAGDGLLDNPVRFIVGVDFWARGVLQEWHWLFNWHVEPLCIVCLFNHIDDSVQVSRGCGAK